jgi:hypothetical protein
MRFNALEREPKLIKNVYEWQAVSLIFPTIMISFKAIADILLMLVIVITDDAQSGGSVCNS